MYKIAFTTLCYWSTGYLLSFVHKHSKINSTFSFIGNSYDDIWITVWEVILLRPFDFLASEELYIIQLACYLAMSVSWWWLFQKLVVAHKLEIYIFTEHCVCIVMLQMINKYLLDDVDLCFLSCCDEYKIVQLSIFVLELCSVEH